MDIDKLIEAIRLCGSQPDVRQCRNCAYYAGGDMSRCIPRMTAEAAEALSTLKAELEQAKREGMSMERLTYWCDDGRGGGEWRVNIYGREESGPHVDRLAAYEDTGLEPEEIEQLKGEVFGLRLDKRELERYRALGSIERLRELKQADDEWRCVVLPLDDYTWTIRGDIVRGIIKANCRAAKKEAEAALRREQDD